jgi:RimJ/RimL family protein N-acetyltransferase
LKLIDVYEYHGVTDLLFALLGEREPHECISHKRMPSFAEHVNFFKSRPYDAWDVIEIDGDAVGAIYLTKQDEIGIAVLLSKRGNGYAEQAIHLFQERHPRKRYLANINPANEASIALFRKLGFEGPVQVTYERRA